MMTLRWPTTPRISKPQAGQLRAARSTTLTLSGFACFVVAAFVLHLVAGLVVLGLSCWVIELLTGGEGR